MNKNKGDAGNIAGFINLENELTMINLIPTQNKFQFNSVNPPKVFELINCNNCNNERQFDGYVFKLVPVCADCRTEAEVQITRNRIGRRAKR